MIRTISIEDLIDRQSSEQRFQLVDVRSATEFATGHIPGALNVPLEQVIPLLSTLNIQTPLVMVCQSGRRARMAAEKLGSHVSQIEVLEAGTAGWIQQKQPVVRTTSNNWSLERQVRLGAGLLGLAGGLLTLAVHRRWVYLNIFVGAGLSFAGLSDICLMGSLLARMPWNKPVQNLPPIPLQEDVLS